MLKPPAVDPVPKPSNFPSISISDFVPRSLGTRLALTYTGLALLIMAGLGWSTAATIRDFYVAQVQTELMRESIVAGDVLAPLLRTSSDSAALNSAADRLAQGFGARLTVIAADGAVLVNSDHDADSMENHLSRPEVQDALRSGSGSSFRPSTTLDEKSFYAARLIANGNAVLRLGVSLDTVDGLVRDIQRQVVTAAFLAAILMTGAGWFVARRIGTALGDIREQATAIAAGQLDVAVEPAPTRELGDLARAFNSMTARLQGTMAELERVRVRLEATLANLSDGVMITDERGHIVLANDAALVMLAVRGAVIGEPFVAVARDHELADLVSEALTMSEVPEDRVIRHGLSGRIIQAAARRLDAAEESIGVVVLRDVTELRRLESIRRDFVANVSHELRTPLTSIRALVETLEAGALHDPTVSNDFLARIVSEVDRLAQIVDELLDLARLESGRIRLSLELVEPESLIRRVLERIAPQTVRAGVTVDFAVAPATPTIVADRARVDQIMLNLVHNAVKFTPSGGAITLLAAPTDGFVEFQVRDTGVGVNPEDLPRLFERFYKADRARRSQGTGLGLAIAKHIVQAHGGRIWAEPNREGGTVFRFTLPVDGPARSELNVEAAGDSV